MLERDFQSDLIKDLKDIFDGCIVLKNDPNYIQGFPDLLILFNNHWAVLEVKKNGRATYQPNQEYYLDLLGSMSFSATIYPENKEEVIRALQRSFGH